MEEVIEKLREFKAIQETNLEKGEMIVDISYYFKITLLENHSNSISKRKEDLYLVKKEINGKTEFEFRVEEGIIATVVDGQIQISQDYKKLINENEFLLQLKNIMPLSLKKLEELEQEPSNISKIDEKEEKIEPEEQAENDEQKDTPKKYIENPKDIKIDLSKKNN